MNFQKYLPSQSLGSFNSAVALLTVGPIFADLAARVAARPARCPRCPFAMRRHPPLEENLFGRYRASTNKLGSPFSRPVRLQANTDLSQFLMGLYPNSGPRLGANSEERLSLVLAGQSHPLASGTHSLLTSDGSPRIWRNVRHCRTLPVTSSSVAATTATHILPTNPQPHSSSQETKNWRRRMR